mmetsp:Transcript_5458/g.19222  ORF Transcript_5458/g.19222 Transcript_5458/m.19222 type:complete len:140 (-) Transcript_5458:1377-1796(-)
MRSLVAGTLYPCYASYKALQTNAPESSVKWLTYWIVYGFIGLAELVLSPLIYLFPVTYYTIKLVFVIWLQVPKTDGATKVYNMYMMPFFKKHEVRIDAALEEGKKTAERNFKLLKGRGEAIAPNLFQRTAASTSSTPQT